MIISVVMSTYNGELYVLEQLDSIRKQTYTPQEVLICDDCSTDNTVNIIKDYINHYNLTNWKFEINKANQGWKNNFKSLIDKSNGDIIFLCDQDDIWDVSKIEKMKNIFLDNLDVNILVCGYDPLYEDDSIKKIPEINMKDMKNSGTLSKKKLDSKFLFVNYPGCTYAFKKNFWEECSPIWDKSMPHDSLLWRCGILLECLYIYDENLIKWRRFKASSTTTININKTQDKVYDELNIKCKELDSHIMFLKKYIDFRNYKNKKNDENIMFLKNILKCDLNLKNILIEKNILTYFYHINSIRKNRFSYRMVISDVLYMILGKIYDAEIKRG